MWEKKWTDIFESINAIKCTKSVQAAKKASKLFIRNFRVKKKLREVRERVEMKMRNHLTMHRAALRIQCAYRGGVARRNVKYKIEEREKRRVSVRVQALAR